jgi:hypothetical protein
LGAANLAAIIGNGGIVGHVLGLERQHAKPALNADPAETRSEQGLSDI